MALRPPSLRAVAAFESAARHQNFTRAAEELHLSHSAISHAIRTLEVRLGTRLFDRVGKKVVLTSAGRRLAERVRSSLAVLSDVLDLKPEHGRRRLVVAACPEFAALALARRLQSFRQLQPDVQIELRCRPGAPIALGRGDVDVAIRYCAPWEPGAVGRQIAREALLPVAAATFAGRLQTLRDVTQCPLLEHVEAPWRDWLARMAPPAPPVTPRLIGDDWAVLVKAAEAGLGVLLARNLLVDGRLASGALVRSQVGGTPAGRAYYCEWDADSPRAALIETFADWLDGELEAARRTRPNLGPRLGVAGTSL